MKNRPTVKLSKRHFSHRIEGARPFAGIVLLSMAFLISQAHAIAESELSKLNADIAKCYQTGDLEKAAEHWRRVIEIIEKADDPKALEQAKKNYAMLEERLKKRGQGSSVAKTTSAASSGSASFGQTFGSANFGAASAAATNKSSDFSKSTTSKKKKYDESSKEYKAISLDEKARSLSNSGDNNKALELMAEAVRTAPDISEIWYNKGLIEQRLGKRADANESFQRASTDPELTSKCQILIAKNLSDLGNPSKAKELLWQLKRSNRSNQSREASVDGALVELGDEQAINNSQMLANASARNVLLAIKKLSSSSANSKHVVELCKVLESKEPTAENEEYIAHYLVKSNNYVDAMNAYKRWDEMDPSNKSPLLGVIACATQAGKLDDLQAAREAFVSRFPDDERAKTMKEALGYYAKEFERTKEREKEPEKGRGDIAHFGKNEMPLKVYVPNIQEATANWEPKPDDLDYDNLVQRAQDEWTQASEGQVTFQRTNSVDNANISIEWVEDSDKMQHSFAAGTTGYATNARGQARHNLKLLVPTKRSSGNERQVLETTVHEFGHALGLSHSTNPNDIMYFSNTRGTEIRNLSDNDRKRISDLYKRN